MRKNSRKMNPKRIRAILNLAHRISKFFSNPFRVSCYRISLILMPLLGINSQIKRQKSGISAVSPLTFIASRFVQTALITIVFTLPPLNVGAQTVPVRDLAEVDGARPNFLRGYGIVVGLKGNGDSPKGETSRMLKNFLANVQGYDIAEIQSKNVALVAIEAELPPFQKAGTKIDIRVSALGDAKSLNGGTLLMTPLRSPRARADEGGDLIWALAQGRLLLEGDERLGNPTTAFVPNGAIIERELKHEFVKYTDETKKRPFIRLLIRKTDFTVASQIATDINNIGIYQIYGHQKRWKQGKEPTRIAKAIDGGSIEVRIPTKEEYDQVVEPEYPYPNYDKDPVTFIEKILNISVNLIRPDQALVIINDTTKLITITGEVMVKPGHVQSGVQSGGSVIKITIASEMKLIDFLNSKEMSASLTTQQLIDVIKQLAQSDLIKGKVISK